MIDQNGSQRLDPNTVMLWRMQRLVRLVLVTIPMLIALGIASATTVRAEVAVVVVVTLVAMNVVFTLFWPAGEKLFFNSLPFFIIVF